jgi:DNA-binding MarR family transcriptional regulator
MRPRYDEVLHSPLRLQACAVLAGASSVEFAVLRDALEVSESVLSKHLKQLAEAGYVKVRKASTDGRVRGWATLTSKGQDAFAGHVAELRRLAATVARQPTDETNDPIDLRRKEPAR